MACPFCNGEKAVSTSFPRNIFNNKTFNYIRCTSCRLIYLDNFPEKEDYDKMYPPSYQRNGVENEIQQDPYVKLYGLRFSYGYQFDLIKKQTGAGAKILDYGCGTGHFLANAVHYGFDCDGAEFNPDYIKILAQAFSQSSFYAIENVLAPGFTGKYDVIRLSNVLEHLTNPLDVIKKLATCLKPGGILLVEGPVEENFCIARLFRSFYFRVTKLIRPNRTVADAPYHIFLSTSDNQRQFFRDCGLTETHYKTSEDPWPFPSSFRKAKGAREKITAIVAKISMKITAVSGRNWGNIFIYSGKQVDR